MSLILANTPLYFCWKYLSTKKHICPIEGHCMLQVQIIIFGTVYQHKSAPKEAELTFTDL